jgi:hypothetical protein
MSKKDRDIIYKLEQLRKPAQTLTKEKLEKRAKAKYSQEPLLLALLELKESKLAKNYKDAFFCSSVLTQKGDKLTSRYCKNRFCRVCNRISTGKLINNYAPILDKLTDKQFVTLTIPNVVADELRPAIIKMNKVMRLIQDKRRKAKIPLIKGIRKLECTYNTFLNNYHPHFHLIIENEAQATDLINEWLFYYPEAVIQAQHKAEATECIELFKYFTKLTSNTGATYENGSKVKDEWQFPEAIDVIFTHIAKLRIVQSMGGIRLVDDKIKDLEAQIVDKETIKEYTGVYFWYGENWYDPYTGELITNFCPTENLNKYRKKIRYLQKEKQYE